MKRLSCILLMLMTLLSCDNLSFGNSNSNSSSNSQSINVSSQVNSQEGENELEKSLNIFAKAMNNELDYNYEYYIYSCYDGKSFFEEKVVQQIEDELWYKEDSVIYNVTSKNYYAYLNVRDLGYVRYQDDDYDNERFSHHSWIETLLDKFIKENKTYDSETLLYNQYYISSDYESINERECLTIFLQPYFEGSKKYYKINLYLGDVSNSLKITNNFIREEEYFEIVKNEASKLQFNTPFAFLDKVEGYYSDEEYYINPGFGIESYSPKVYGKENFYEAFNNREEVVYFEVTSFPDCFNSQGTFITALYISAKDVTFNGLSLGNTTLVYINTLFTMELGYSVTTSTNHLGEEVHSYYKNGISVNLFTKDDVLLAISFVFSVSNVFNIIY